MGRVGTDVAEFAGQNKNALMRYDDAMRIEYKIHLDFCPTQFPRHDDEHSSLRKPGRSVWTRPAARQSVRPSRARVALSLSLVPADVRDESI